MSDFIREHVRIRYSEAWSLAFRLSAFRGYIHIRVEREGMGGGGGKNSILRVVPGPFGPFWSLLGSAWLGLGRPVPELHV